MASIAENLRATLLSLKQISDRVKSLVTTSVTNSEATADTNSILTALNNAKTALRGGDTTATLTDFLADGWREYIAPVPEPYIPTHAELVEQYIREHGYETYGAELAVVNNYSENPSEYLESWQHYQGVRHDAKEWANKQPHRDE